MRPVCSTCPSTMADLAVFFRSPSVNHVNLILRLFTDEPCASRCAMVVFGSCRQTHRFRSSLRGSVVSWVKLHPRATSKRSRSTADPCDLLVRRTWRRLGNPTGRDRGCDRSGRFAASFGHGRGDFEQLVGLPKLFGQFKCIVKFAVCRARFVP
jgi:hypothetical protein